MTRYRILVGQHSQSHSEPVWKMDAAGNVVKDPKTGKPVPELDEKTGLQQTKVVHELYRAYNPKTQTLKERCDVFETHNDMLKHNMGILDRPKFAIVGQEGAAGTDPTLLPRRPNRDQIRDTLEDMTVAELMAIAAGDEIDLGDATKKADIIEKILPPG